MMMMTLMIKYDANLQDRLQTLLN